MAEYIEREAIVKILRDEAKAAYPTPYHIGLYAASRVIDAIPAADVRPVVLCRECKWAKTDGMDDPAIYCMKWDRWEMPHDGFCWLGEKREES